MKKWLRKGLAAALALAMFVGTAAMATPVKADDAEPIKVGVMTILTGDKAIFGFAERDGSQMAADDINAAGGILGRPVELYFGDTQANAQEGVNALRQLLDQNDVDIIIGPGQSGTVIACAPMVNDAKVPLLCSTATNPKVTINDDGSLNEYVWRLCFTDPYQGKVIAQYAYKELGMRKAVILYDVGSDYAVGLNQYFEDNFTKLGGELVAKMGYKTNDVDFRSQLTELKDMDWDMIMLPNNYKDIALIANQMMELGIEGKQIMCGDSGQSAALLDMAPEAFEGAYIVSNIDKTAPEVVALMDRYVEEYNLTATPEPNCVIHYDLMTWVKDVIERAGSTEPEALHDAINETKDLMLKTGNLTMGAEDHNPVNRPACMLHVVDGKHEYLGMYTPED